MFHGICIYILTYTVYTFEHEKSWTIEVPGALPFGSKSDIVAFVIKLDAFKCSIKRSVYVNDLQLLTGGLPFGLHLDSAATRRTCAGLPLWLHRPMHQGAIDRRPVWLQHAGTRAFINRPRTFYPGMAFLPGTLPFRWKGTTKANRLSPANRSA
jgi:hypothetical protein